MSLGFMRTNQQLLLLEDGLISHVFYATESGLPEDIANHWMNCGDLPEWLKEV